MSQTDPQTVTFTKSQMLEWLDEAIRREAELDDRYPSGRFKDQAIVRQIREVVANAQN